MNISKYNPKNIKIMDEYVKYLTKEAKEKIKDTTASDKIRSVRMYETLFKYEDLELFSANKGIDFCESLKQSDSSYSTIIKHKRNVKAFFEWFFTTKKIKSAKKKLYYLATLEPSPEEIRLARCQEIVQYPTDEEIDKIMSLEIRSDIDKRNIALIAFLIITGMRIEATLTITIDLIDIDKHLVNQDPIEGVHTKRDKYIVTRFLEHNQSLVNIFLSWYNTVKQHADSDKFPLFPKIGNFDKGLTYKNKHMEYNEASSIIKKVQEKAGIKNKDTYSPHAFRHYTIFKALKYVKNGIQLKALSQNVGHEGINTILEQYANMLPEIYTEIIAHLFETDINLANYSDEDLINELQKRQQAKPIF